MIRLGIDVGGTFTDVVVLDEESGATSWFKTPTDHGRLAGSVLGAIERTEVPMDFVSHVKVGTTLALNTILTRSGAPTGLLTTEGFRDVLEIRRTHRQHLFDLDERVPEPIVPRDLRLEIPERVGFDGSVVRSLDEDVVRRAWRALRDRGIRALAIVFLFSFKNPDHERRAREIVVEEGGADVVFISSDVLPAHREYERTSTTVIAAYVAPGVRGYVAELTDRLERDGLRRGRLAVMTNSGGAMSGAEAERAPVPTLLSGPAGGVEAMRWLAERAGADNVLTLDVGGTSTDVSGIVAGVPDERLDMEVDGHAITYPTFDIQTIGAGGGSIAWIDSGGSLRVGPASAGSEPGPACYGIGGTQPTVTDANLVLGRYSDDVPLGGSIRLDLGLARKAIAAVAEPLGLSTEQAAAGIVRIVNSHIVNAVRTISVERGRDAREFALAAFGGAGPTHAAEVGLELSIPTVLVPPFPGCTSAFGAVVARTRRDYLRTVAQAVGDLDPGQLQALAASLKEQVLRALAEEGYSEPSALLELWMDLRYRGQAYDLAIAHDSAAVTAGSIAASVRGFHDLHEQLYGHAFDDVPVELVNLRVTGYGVPEEPPMSWDWGDGGPAAFEVAPERPVHFRGAGGWLDARVLDRVEIEPDESVDGPAVIHQLDSTVLVPPGMEATAHPTGSLIITTGVGGLKRRTAKAKASV